MGVPESPEEAERERLFLPPRLPPSSASVSFDQEERSFVLAGGAKSQGGDRRRRVQPQALQLLSSLLAMLLSFVALSCARTSHKPSRDATTSGTGLQLFRRRLAEDNHFQEFLLPSEAQDATCEEQVVEALTSQDSSTLLRSFYEMMRSLEKQETGSGSPIVQASISAQAVERTAELQNSEGENIFPSSSTSHLPPYLVPYPAAGPSMPYPSTSSLMFHPSSDPSGFGLPSASNPHLPPGLPFPIITNEAAWGLEAAASSVSSEVPPNASSATGEGRSSSEDETARSQLVSLLALMRRERKRLADTREVWNSVLSSPFKLEEEDAPFRFPWIREQHAGWEVRGILGGRSASGLSLRLPQRELVGEEFQTLSIAALTEGSASIEEEVAALLNVPFAPEESRLYISVWAFGEKSFGAIQSTKALTDSVEDVEGLLANEYLTPSDCNFILERTKMILQRMTPFIPSLAYQRDGWRKVRRAACMLRCVDVVFRVANIFPTITRCNEWFHLWIDFLNAEGMLRMKPATKSLDIEFFWRRCANLVIAYKSGFRAPPEELIHIRKIYEAKYRTRVGEGRRRTKALP